MAKNKNRNKRNVDQNRNAGVSQDDKASHQAGRESQDATSRHDNKNSSWDKDRDMS